MAATKTVPYGIQRPRRPEQWLTTDEPEAPSPITRPQTVPQQTPQTVPGPDGEPVDPAKFANTDTRPRIADPAGRAEDDYYAATNAVPQKMPRWKAALQMIAQGLGRAPVGDTWSAVAGQVGAAAGSAVAGAIDPSIPGKIKKEYNINRSYSRVKQVESIENTKSLRASREAAANYKTRRLAQFDSAAQEKSRFNDWRIRSGDRKSDQYGDWLKWRKQNGDQQQHTREDFLAWRQEAETRVDSDRDREYGRRVNHDKFNNELRTKQLALAKQREARLAAGGAAAVDSSGEEVDYWNQTAEIYRNNAEEAASADNEEDEATYRALERHARQQAGTAAAHGIRTRAKAGAKGSAGPATPAKDPLGLFQ